MIVRENTYIITASGKPYYVKSVKVEADDILYVSAVDLSVQQMSNEEYREFYLDRPWNRDCEWVHSDAFINKLRLQAINCSFYIFYVTEVDQAFANWLAKVPWRIKEAIWLTCQEHYGDLIANRNLYMNNLYRAICSYKNREITELTSKIYKRIGIRKIYRLNNVRVAILNDGQKFVVGRKKQRWISGRRRPHKLYKKGTKVNSVRFKFLMPI